MLHREWQKGWRGGGLRAQSWWRGFARGRCHGKRKRFSFEGRIVVGFRRVLGGERRDRSKYEQEVEAMVVG